MTTKITYSVDKKDLDSFMAQYSSDMVLAWLCGVRISTPTVCDILKMSPRTLTNWIKSGQLRIINEGEKSHEFDLHDVVKLLLIRANKFKSI